MFMAMIRDIHTFFVIILFGRLSENDVSDMKVIETSKCCSSAGLQRPQVVLLAVCSRVFPGSK